MTFPTHKLRGRARPAGEVVTEFLNCNEVHKSARVKQLMKELPSDFMCENILPFMAKNITLYEFLLQRCCTDLTEKENTRQTKMCNELTDMLNTIKQKNPEVYNYILPTKTETSNTSLVQIDPNVFDTVNRFPQPNAITSLVQINANNFKTPSRFPQPNVTFSCKPKLKTFKMSTNPIKFIDDISTSVGLANFLTINKELTTSAVLEEKNGYIFKNLIIPTLIKKHEEDLKEISVTLTSNFNISYNKYQLIVRNQIGSRFSKICGHPIFTSRDKVFQKIISVQEEIKEKLSLQFCNENENSTIAAYIDVRKSLSWFLDQPHVKELVNLDSGTIVTYVYTDAFPWMLWSRFFHGETAIRMKIVEKSNSLDTIMTLGSWLGPDDHLHTSTLGKFVYEQLQDLKEVNVPSIGKVNVLVRGCADRSGRRSSSGVSTARSSYPIEEAPEHLSQLGDMSIYCHEPLWTVENTKDTEKNYVKWLNGKKDTNENRRQFSQKSLGRFASNAIMMDMKDFYSGITHKVCRVAESIALRVNVVCQQFPSASKKFVENIRSIKGKVHNKKSIQISFSQADAMTFFKKGDELLQDIGLDEITYYILSQYLTNIGAFVDELIDADPIRFTRDYFEIQSRIMVGFPSVLIFGTKMITASMKQQVVYEGYYVGKALEDCKYAGKGLSRKNITDDILETKHKDAK